MITGAVALAASPGPSASLQLLLASVLALSLLTLALIDARLYVLPDQITLPLMWLGLLVNTQEHFAPVAAATLAPLSATYRFGQSTGCSNCCATKRVWVTAISSYRRLLALG